MYILYLHIVRATLKAGRSREGLGTRLHIIYMQAHVHVHVHVLVVCNCIQVPFIRPTTTIAGMYNIIHTIIHTVIHERTQLLLQIWS
jgi:hypothetical protein